MGDDYLTPLSIKLNSFANGYSQIKTIDGELLSQYCALDKRFIKSSNNAYMQILEPNDNIIQVKIVNDKKNEMKLSIYNILGRLVKEIDFTSEFKLIEINKSELESGIYLVKLVNGSELLIDKFAIWK